MRVPQPTPTVTAADVERVARRDFPEEQMPVVMEVLGEYGNEHREVNRVRLAVLKLANRKLQELRYWMEQAKCDYRDVLGPAEYPLYGKKWGRMDKMSEEEQQKIIQSDWAQYEKWLNG
jgi:hypothetical protein